VRIRMLPCAHSFRYLAPETRAPNIPNRAQVPKLPVCLLDPFPLAPVFPVPELRGVRSAIRRRRLQACG
jgi:hypothetical protein